MAESTPSTASDNVVSLTAEIRKLKQELATLNPNSAAFQELANRAGQLKDNMNDAAEAMNANAGSAFERLKNNSELLKDRLMNLDFEGITSSVKGLAGQVSGLTFKGAVDGVKGLTGAFKALGTALLTNPIFLIVAALVAIGGAIKMILDDQRNDVDAANKAITASNEQRHNIERLRMAEAAGNEKKLADLKKKSMQEDIADTKMQIDNLMWMESQAYGLSEQQEKDLDDLRKKYAQQRVDYEIEALKQIQILNAANLEYDKIIMQSGMTAREIERDNLQQWYADQREKIDAAGANEEDIYKLDWAYGEKKKQLQEKFRTEDAAKSKAANDKKAADDKAAREADLKNQEEIHNLILELEAMNAADEVALNAARLKRQEDYYKVSEFLITDAKEKEISALVVAYEEQFELANGNDEKEKALAEQQKKDLADIEEKYRKEQADKDKTAADDKFATEKQLKEQRIQMASDAIGALMALNEAFTKGGEKSARKSFQINKALSMAQAIMSTYQAVNAQLSVPQDAITGANYVKAGISLAMGLANVAKIAKTQFQATVPSDGGGGNLGGGGGGGGVSMTSVTPTFNPLNTSFLNNRPSQTGAVQAFVLSSNVSSALETNQKIQDQTVL
jgi:hypothetical protein